jgi:hypothetical protein
MTPPTQKKTIPPKQIFDGAISAAFHPGLIPIYIDPQPLYAATSLISLPPHDDFTSLITTGGRGSSDLPTKMPPGKRSTTMGGGETGS